MRVFLFCLMLLTAPAAFAGGCDGAFADFLYNGTVRLADSEIPRRIPVSVNRSTMEQYFSHFQQLWQSSFDAGRIQTILGRVSRGEQISEADIVVLKQVRKSGSALRNAFQIFDDGHEPPRKFVRFVVDFGHLNDLLKNAAARKQLARQAGDLSAYINENKKYLSSVTDRFTAANRDSFEKHIVDSLKEARAIAAKTALSEKDHHELRKLLREFLYYHLAKFHAEPTELNRRSFQLLYEISEGMGLQRDGVVLEEGVEALADAVFRLSGPLRIRIQGYLNAVRVES